MSEKPAWRQAYDAAERSVAPRVEALVHSEEFAHATTAITRAQRTLGRQVTSIQARLWHLLNLPAGTDVQRLRTQVGALDRQVRLLTLQLDHQVNQRDSD
jgi:hypothetical protein